MSKATAQSGKMKERASSTCVAQQCGSIVKVFFTFSHFKVGHLIPSEKWKIFNIWLFGAEGLPQRTLTSLLRPLELCIHHEVWTPASSSSVHWGQGGWQTKLSGLSPYLIKRFGDAGLQLPVQRSPHLQAAVISLRGNVFPNRVPGQPLYQARMASQSS